MKRVLENCPRLTLRQGSVESLIVENGEIKGVETQIGERFFGRRVILTTGTFLKGLVHIGDRNFSAGRAGDFAVQGLSESLVNLGFAIGRLKTGTCPRLDARTINYSELVEQHGDVPPQPFSYASRQVTQRQVPCHITYTNSKTHDIIRKAIHRSPMYLGCDEKPGTDIARRLKIRFIDSLTRKDIRYFLSRRG